MTFALILRVIRRRWRVIAAFAVLGLLAGLVLWAVVPTKYSATTSLVVSAGVSNPFTGTKEEVNIRTEQEILGSREVAQRASKALGVTLQPGSSLLSQVDVAAPSGSQVLQVTVTSDSPKEAAAAADALSEAYLEFRREGADAVVNGYLEKIDEQLAALQAGERDEAAQRLIETLQQQRLSLLLSSAEPGRIIGAAEVPTSPSTPGRTVSLAGGLGCGILLGIAGAILRERTDPLVRSADRLAARAGTTPIVATADAAELWSAISEHVAEIGRASASHRVLLRAVDSTDTSSLRDGLERAILSLEKEAAALGADPWASGAAEPRAMLESGADRAEPDRAQERGSRRDGRAVRVVDASAVSALAFARLAAKADVVVLSVSADARLTDVDAVLETIDGVQTPVVIAFAAALSTPRSAGTSRARSAT